MMKINIISEDWSLIQNINVNVSPQKGDYLYLRSKKNYYKVITRIFDIESGWFSDNTNTSLVVEPVDFKNKKKDV